MKNTKRTWRLWGDHPRLHVLISHDNSLNRTHPDMMNAVLTSTQIDTEEDLSHKQR